MQYFELLVHACPARCPRGQEVRCVIVEKVRGHQSVTAQDSLHQSIMNEHILLLKVSIT